MLKEKEILFYQFLAGLDVSPDASWDQALVAESVPKKTKIIDVAPTTSFDTLDQIKAALQAFQGSAHKKSAKNMVFGEGNVPSKLMIIGDAPDADEDRLGRPAVGKSGEMLNLMLEAMGIKRASCYIAPLYYWRIYNDAPVTQADFALTVPFLYEQIRLINPDIIVCLGGAAAKFLTGVEASITQIRGKFYPYIKDEKCKVLPIFHPAQVMKNPLYKKYVWQDLLMLRKHCHPRACGDPAK